MATRTIKVIKQIMVKPITVPKLKLGKTTTKPVSSIKVKTASVKKY